MRIIRIPGILAYATMAMWLVLTFASPARADEAPRSRLIDHAAEIAEALFAQGVSPDAKLTFAAPDAIISAGAQEALAILSASFNAASGRFLVRAADSTGVVYAVTGSAVVPTLVPVPARAIARGETMTDADLNWVEISDGRAAQFLADAEAIIGKTARRPLVAGAPLRKADLASPILIKRGASVTIILESKGIRLSQVGVALANGAKDDLIAFRNVNSDREIKAVVIAENLARAPFASHRAFTTAELE